MGRFVYGHGETFYNFKGLRAYKEKFHPEWEPRYLAYPGGLALPRILADVSALIAGGYRQDLCETDQRLAVSRSAVEALVSWQTAARHA